MARQGQSKRSIKESLERLFGYDLSQRLDDMRPTYEFDISCQGTVPPDTLACITGAVAEAHYGGVPADIAARTMALLDERLRRIVVQFCDRYIIGAA